MSSINTKVVENVGIEIPFSNGNSIKIYSVYFPGGAANSFKREALKSDLRKLTNLNGRFIIGGDLNCRHRNWNCSRSNSYGNILSDVNMTNNFLILHPSHPTYIPSSSRFNPSTLDLFLTNSVGLVSQPTVINDLSSDHLPVLCSILSSPVIENSFIYDFKAANWNRYKSTVKRMLESVHVEELNVVSSSDLDQLIEYLNTLILESINVSVPKRSVC